MARGPSPLLGYNTNLRHHGKVYHVQTEDSGVGHPHVMTHLFADGGRIIASRKTSYAEHVAAANFQEIVKKLMQTQHKAMCIALRDGEFDTKPESAEPAVKAQAASKSKAATEPAIDDLERAAEARLAESALTRAPVKRRPASTPLGRMSRKTPKPKKLDDAIRAYLEDDEPEPKA
jgi:hypothetical protein